MTGKGGPGSGRKPGSHNRVHQPHKPRVPRHKPTGAHPHRVRKPKK